MPRPKKRAPLKNPQIGKNLRRLRLAKKLSIRAFCAKAKPPLAPVQLLATEKGRREPTVDMLLRYSDVLGCKIADLVGERAS